MNKSDEIIMKKEPSKIRKMSVGISEEEILIAFNCNEKNEPEYACVLPAEKLQDMITVLFKCGVHYQNEYGKDIGFGMKE